MTYSQQLQISKRHGSLEQLSGLNSSDLKKVNLNSSINSNDCDRVPNKEFKFNTRRGYSLAYDNLQHQMNKESNQQNINMFKNSNNGAINNLDFHPNLNQKSSKVDDAYSKKGAIINCGAVESPKKNKDPDERPIKPAINAGLFDETPRQKNSGTHKDRIVSFAPPAKTHSKFKNKSNMCKKSKHKQKD